MIVSRGASRTNIGKLASGSATSGNGWPTGTPLLLMRCPARIDAATKSEPVHVRSRAKSRGKVEVIVGFPSASIFTTFEAPGVSTTAIVAPPAEATAVLNDGMAWDVPGRNVLTGDVSRPLRSSSAVRTSYL